jgi:hypothetical protein
MKEDELRELARVLKIHEKNVSITVVQANILRTIKTKPTTVMNILNSSTYKTESMRVLLLDSGVITKTSKGYFTNPDRNSGNKPEFIAYTDADLSGFLIEKRNLKLTEEWIKEAKGKLSESN